MNVIKVTSLNYPRHLLLLQTSLYFLLHIFPTLQKQTKTQLFQKESKIHIAIIFVTYAKTSDWFSNDGLWLDDKDMLATAAIDAERKKNGPYFQTAITVSERKSILVSFPRQMSIATSCLKLSFFFRQAKRQPQIFKAKSICLVEEGGVVHNFDTKPMLDFQRRFN